jgi:hypothetical protein
MVPRSFADDPTHVSIREGSVFNPIQVAGDGPPALFAIQVQVEAMTDIPKLIGRHGGR